MYELIEHIEYLVCQHDCVVIPGVGAIIAYHVPAYIDSEHSCIYPPKRALSFNTQINHFDGLLAASVSRREKVSFEKASDMVSKSVSDIMNCLDSQNEVSLGRVGALRKNAENIIEYIPGANTDFSGLLCKYTPVKFEKELIDSPIVKSEITKPRKSVIHRFINAAASVIILIMLGFMLSTPIIDNEAVFASMSAFKPANTNAVEQWDFNASEIELNIAIPDHNTATGMAEERNNTTDVETENMYYVIVASLPNEEIAQKFIAENNNISENFKILKSNKRCRVYIDKANSIDSALKALSQSNRKQQFPDAWVFRK